MLCAPAGDDEPLTVCPIRDVLYVEKIPRLKSSGGIHLVEVFKAGKSGLSARERMNAIPDYFMVRVLATGPEVQKSEAAGLFQGDHALVWSYAAGDGSKLMTGDGSGEKDRLFIKPNDVVCAIDPTWCERCGSMAMHASGGDECLSTARKIAVGER